MTAEFSGFRAIQFRTIADMLSVFASRFGGIVVSLLFLPIYSRLLSPDAFGLVALLLSIQSFFLVSDLGLATLLARDTAIARGTSRGLLEVARNRRRAEIILFAPVLIVSLFAFAVSAFDLFDFTWRDAGRIVLGMSLVALLVLLNIAQLCLNSLGQYQLNSIITTTGILLRATITALALAFVDANFDIFLISQVVVSITHYGIARFYLDLKSGCHPSLRDALKNGYEYKILFLRCKSIMLYTLVSAAAVNLDKSILAAFLPIQLTGLYFLSTTYALVPIALLSGPLNQYFSPRIAHAEAEQDHFQRWQLGMTFQLLIVVTVVVPAFILVRHAPELISFWLLGNPETSTISTLASILLVGTAIGATGYYPNTYLIAVADNDFLAKVSAILSIIVLCFAAIFAAMGSMLGVAISYACFHAAGCAVQWYRLRSHWMSDQFRVFITSCYLAPAAALLVICFASWAIASVVTHGLAAKLTELVLQISLGSIAMLSLSRWCYRRTALLRQVPKLKE